MESLVSTTMFDYIKPNSSSVFILKNQLEANDWLYESNIKITVLDSDFTGQPLSVAILIVPKGREFDLLFTTRAGEKELLEMFFNVSRLFVVSNHPVSFDQTYIYSEPREEDESSAKSFVGNVLRNFYPKDSLQAEVKFVKVADGLLLQKRTNHGLLHPAENVRYFLDDEVVQFEHGLELRRKLRFKETGSFVHEQIALTKEGGVDLDDVRRAEVLQLGYKNDMRCIYEPHNRAILFGLKSFIPEKEAKKGLKHMFNSRKATKIKKLLSFGGIGAVGLFHKFRTDFGYEVVCLDSFALGLQYLVECFGVEATSLELLEISPMVLLDYYNSPQSDVGKTILEFVEKHNHPFDVLLVYVKSFDDGYYAAPPRELLTRDALVKMKNIMAEDGVLIIYFVPTNYLTFADALSVVKLVFSRVFKIKVDQTTYVLFATMSVGCDALPTGKGDDLVPEFSVVEI